MCFNVIQELILQEQRPSLTSMATQETTLDDISSTTLNDFHNNPPVTVTVSNDSNIDNNTAATVAPTYVSIAVVYDKVTGDINKVLTLSKCVIILYLSFRKGEVSLSIKNLMTC